MTVFETRKRSNFICISFVLKRQAKIKAVSTQIMCRGKHSNYLLKDETKPIIPSKGLGLQVTNHKNYPLLIFKKLGSSMCLISTKGNFHITCDGITDSFQQYRQWYPLLLIIYQGRITKRTLVKRTKSSIQSYTMSYNICVILLNQRRLMITSTCIKEMNSFIGVNWSQGRKRQYRKLVLRKLYYVHFETNRENYVQA